MNQQDNNHWLVRASTIRLLWLGGSIVLGLTVVAQILIPINGHFVADDWFGFGAVYGFVACFLMVLFAKGLGFVLKRKENFYGTGERLDGDPEVDSQASPQNKNDHQGHDA